MTSIAHLRCVSCLLAGGLVLAATAVVFAQVTKYDRGQDVAPVFEGWEANPDGTYSFVFGYLNRNYEEVLDIPVGPNNFFASGAQDRGQPTHFLPRRNRFLFKVVVPANWEKTRRLIWTLTSRGKTNQAKAWLEPEWEMNPEVVSENLSGGTLEAGNVPPTLTSSGPQTVALPKTLNLTVTASDDGLPKPKARLAPPAATGSAAAPAAGRGAARTAPAATAAGAVPDATANPDAPARRPEGVRIRLLQYRGPGKVAFEPDSVPAIYGKPVTITSKVTFSEPGAYVIRAIAYDGQLESSYDVNVTVTGSAAPNR